MLLVRAWQSPWTPFTHQTFQAKFRAAAVAIAKSTHRLGFPNEVMLSICSYMSRDWWDDPHKQCFNYACVLESSSKLIARNMSRDYNNDNENKLKIPVLQRCPRCNVTMYCSKNCRNRDSYLGHKGMCLYAPFRSSPPDFEEIELYKHVLLKSDDTMQSPSSSYGSNAKNQLPSFLLARTSDLMDTSKAMTEQGNDDNGEKDDQDDDDDESWETVDSGEENEILAETTMSITQHIRKYFPF
jgi:hypothetical protein